MRFIPLSESDRAHMLQTIGVASVSELFADVPDSALRSELLKIPEAMPEFDLAEYFENLAETNNPARPRNSFLGAGAYYHHVPAAVDQLLLRTEFFTCYTPYQPEVSQGTLMASYEFQTYTAGLFQMEVANASMYDGASALAEGVIMASRIRKRPKIVMSNLVNPAWRRVVETYTRYTGIEIVTVDDVATGASVSLVEAVDKSTAAVVVQSPNFLGVIEDLGSIRSACDAVDALMVVAVAEPVSLGILGGPGMFGADIVAGEGRSFGGSLSFGGPGLGMFAVKEKLARQMPGRLVGKTRDSRGRDGYVLTMATREQHIRRERATSNICSNQALCATAAAIHISLLGKRGLKELAEANLSACHYLADRIGSLEGFERACQRPFFNEVAIRLPVSPKVVNKRLARAGVTGGLDLSPCYPELNSTMLFCATEAHSKKSIDNLVEVLSEFEK